MNLLTVHEIEQIRAKLDEEFHKHFTCSSVFSSLVNTYRKRILRLGDFNCQVSRERHRLLTLFKVSFDESLNSSYRESYHLYLEVEPYYLIWEHREYLERVRTLIKEILSETTK